MLQDPIGRRTLLKILSVAHVSGVSRAAETHCSSTGISSSFDNYKYIFFTPEETALLDELMELIIPSDEHSPGAREARVSAFADLMISTGTPKTKEMWRHGLKTFRDEAAKSSVAEALAAAAKEEEAPHSDLGQFFVSLKAITVDGYYTSAVGIHQEMQYQGNEYRTSFPECAHPEHQGKQAATNLTPGLPS